MRTAIISSDFVEAASSVKRRSSAKDQRPLFAILATMDFAPCASSGANRMMRLISFHFIAAGITAGTLAANSDLDDV